jgi:hypothetical protein
MADCCLRAATGTDAAYRRAMNRAADDPEGKVRFAAFQQALQQLGWSDGRNVPNTLIGRADQVIE